MKKIASVAVVCLLVALSSHAAHGTEELVTVITTVHGKKGALTHETVISTERAMTLLDDLKNLTRALRTHDEQAALRIAEALHQDGVFTTDDVFALMHQYLVLSERRYADNNDSNFTLKNIMCAVLGFGDALFAYPVDFAAIFAIVALFGWLPLGILLVLAYSVLWMYVSHLLPVRLVLPITLVGFNRGELTTVGLMGRHTITRVGTEQVAAMLIGFTGIVVNMLFLPKDNGAASAPFFCLGTALLAYEKVEY